MVNASEFPQEAGVQSLNDPDSVSMTTSNCLKPVRPKVDSDVPLFPSILNSIFIKYTQR